MKSSGHFWIPFYKSEIVSTNLKEHSLQFWGWGQLITASTLSESVATDDLQKLHLSAENFGLSYFRRRSTFISPLSCSSNVAPNTIMSSGYTRNSLGTRSLKTLYVNLWNVADAPLMPCDGWSARVEKTKSHWVVWCVDTQISCRYRHFLPPADSIWPIRKPITVGVQ